MKVRLGFFGRPTLSWGELRGFNESKEGSESMCQGAAGDLRSHDTKAGETEMPLCGKESGQACGRDRGSRSPSGSEHLSPCVQGTATTPRSYE